MENKLNGLTFALATAVLILSGVPVIPQSIFLSPRAALAQDDWKSEFEDICSKTQDSLSLTADELKSLVGRCDALKPRIEKLDEAQKKIYLKRLRMCRDLFAFVLESKEGK